MRASRVVRNGAPKRFTRRLLLAMVTSLVLTATACSGEAAPSQVGEIAPSQVGEIIDVRGGDLVAVNPETGEERVLAQDLTGVSNAKWSADGRWVGFETPGSLWVVDRTREPRRVSESGGMRGDTWTWSSTGARIAAIRGSTLSLIDASDGLATATELAPTVGDVTSAPAGSPDGTRIVFGARGGSIFSVDLRTHEHSRLVQLPGENLDSVDGIAWSPDGSRLAIYNDLAPGSGRLFVLKADGSGIDVLAEDENVFGFDWSPDGSRIAFTEDHGPELRVFVAPADTSTASLVASLPNDGSIPVWSPDGMQIALGNQNAFLTEDAHNLVIDADGSGDAVPLDDLTYESWRGGSYDCDCDSDIFG